MQIFISSTADSTSKSVMARYVTPLRAAEYLTATRSSHPHLLGLPVVLPYSLPARRMISPVSSRSSVGKGPSPTLVVYALVTPITRSSACGGMPLPTTAPPTDGVEEGANGYVPWSLSSRVACAPS